MNARSAAPFEDLPRAIDVVDHPSTDRYPIDPEAALRTAVTERGEVRAARLNVQANDMNVALADIRGVTVSGPGILKGISGRGTAKSGPAAVVGAHLSIPYTLAAVLLEGDRKSTR